VRWEGGDAVLETYSRDLGRIIADFFVRYYGDTLPVTAG
jgi:hypothetical protein